MKSKIVLMVMVLSVLFSASAEAQGFWKHLGKALGSVVEAAGGVILQEAAVSSGYSREEAAKFTTDVYSALELDTRNAQLGMDWNNAENKYEKQNVAKEFVFDAAADISGQQEFVDKFRVMTDAQLSYLSANKKAVTQEEKQIAFDTRTKAYADLFYDTYQEGKERQAARLAEKMQIKEQLIKSGRYDNSLTAEEVAGSIIAIQKSKDFSYSEKEEMLRSYGFYESPQQIQQLVDEVLAGNSNDAGAIRKAAEEEAIRKAAEEAKRKAAEEEAIRKAAEEEAIRKAAEERKNAIQKVAATKVNGYFFDETALSENQKSELDAVADVLNRYSDVKVLIIGHACKIGYKNINQKKGLKRAEAGKEYLIEKGIAAERISVDSKGETQPFVPNTSNEERKQNRRIEFVIE